MSTHTILYGAPLARVRPAGESGGFGARACLRGLLIVGVILSGGCKDTLVPDFNNPTIPESGVIDRPSRAQVAQMVAGILAGNRLNHADRIRDMEILGRDAYNLDGADPRWSQEMLTGSLTPGGFGARHWLEYYTNIRITNVLLRSLETADPTVFTAGDKAGVRAVARTIKALDLLYIYETHENTGFPVDVGLNVDDLRPILCEGPALAAIVALLDAAATDLRAPGTTFPFTLPAGFAGFNQPATFLTFNRALKAKVEIYRGRPNPTTFDRVRFDAALVALNESFISTSAPLDLGVYHSYSTNSGDQVNELVSGARTFRAHPSVASDAEAGDRRVATKIRTGTADDELSFNTPAGTLRSRLIFTRYAGLSSPIPIVRNEELILLRAEINYNIGDLVAAAADINFIRVNSGGLAPKVLLTADAVRDELLKQKRYSLLWESGARWLDARRYGRFSTLALDRTGDVVHVRFPIPQAEANARNNSIACVATP